MNPRHGDRVQAEGLVVPVQNGPHLAIAALSHLKWTPGQPAPLHHGSEPWLLPLEDTSLVTEGDHIRCEGTWQTTAIRVTQVRRPSGQDVFGSPVQNTTDGEEEFDPRTLPPFDPPPWTDLELDLLDAGLIAGRAYMRGDVLRFAVDDVEAMTPILSKLHRRVEVVPCVASAAVRKLATSIDHLAEEAGVLCSIGSATNLADPAQPLWIYEMAHLTSEVAQVISQVPAEVLHVESHLLLLDR